MTKTQRHLFRAALAYFAVVFGAGFVLGTLRVTLLVPKLGARSAELLEMPVMLLLIVLAARWIVRRFALPAAPGLRWRVGLIALGLLLAAELLLSVAIAGRSVGEYIASRDPVSGSVYLVMLALFAAMPALLRNKS
jgi:membrane protease YdiL (CAAX protease family)